MPDKELLGSMMDSQQYLKRSRKKKDSDTRYTMLRDMYLTKAKIAFACAQVGLFKQQILNVLDWTEDHLKLSGAYPVREAIRRGTILADKGIIAALRRSAEGFTGPNGIYYPPDIRAAQFWLTTRHRETWGSMAAASGSSQNIHVYLPSNSRDSVSVVEIAKRKSRKAEENSLNGQDGLEEIEADV